MEQDKDLILESYASLVPEALGGLDSKERRKVYSVLGLTVEALPDGALKSAARSERRRRFGKP
jgi:hypothetical protein